MFHTCHFETLLKPPVFSSSEWILLFIQKDCIQTNSSVSLRVFNVTERGMSSGM